uniref:Reverse transcriptase domain-containing protein n=1 Tax=Anolis carolinensis TaxID=28377 RepID=A0A803TW33_ANOCA
MPHTTDIRYCSITYLVSVNYSNTEIYTSDLTQKHMGKEFYSSSLEKKRGVVIYVKEKITADIAFKDNDGRFVGIVAQIENKKILICNIYAPNGPKTQFIKSLREKIWEQEFEDLIILGDFNGVMNLEMDRTRETKGQKKKGGGTLPKGFLNLKQELNLQDVWRLHHSKERDFTFYSNRHQEWSRIDMVWASNCLSTKISKIEILTRIHSDHNPIKLIINDSKRIWRWKLNDVLFKSEEDINRNKELLKEYFQINDTGETSIQTIWDASKAVMRGHFIRQKSWMNKQKNQKLQKVQELIREMEDKLKKSPKQQEYKKKLEMLQVQKDSLELDQLAKKLKYIKQDHFQNANKPNRWLARKIGRKKQKRHISKIEEGGKSYWTDKDIINQFEKFYKDLYKNDQIKKEEIMKYLNKRNLQKISEKQRENLNKPINEQEIKTAIRKMDSNKAPGPDGFTAAYYKTFEQELIPYLIKLMNGILNQEKIPETWKEANITIIHKEGSDPVNVKNYRPISLLNIDYKIFTSILSERMKKFLMDLIKEEQTGFLPNRHLRDNVRIIIDIIEYYEANSQKEMALMAVDAEKAFDNINWDFFKILMKEIDIGYQFLNAIEAIYKEQTAKILINGSESKTIKIQKGTRQGCPLSPLIFIFAIEILLNVIREDPNLKGTKIRNLHYKIRAFADDLIFIIENPTEDIQKWIEKINDFGLVAGFKLNKKKSMILTKNMNKKEQEKLKEISGIQITNKINYLGINITAKNSQLLKNNYEEKWVVIKKNLEDWKTLKLSLLGRISVIKMNILPKMLFLFQNLPIIRNQTLFQKWKKDLSKFVWQGKRPRIKHSNLIDETKRGGLGMPDLRLYYEACALLYVKDWTTLKRESIINLEGHDLRTGWHAYLWYDKIKLEKNFCNHFIRSAVIKIWNKYKARIYPKTPLWISPLEACQRRLSGMEKWPLYKDIIVQVGGQPEMRTQEDIKVKFTNISWFQYRQLRESFNKDRKQGFMDKETFWDRIMTSEKKVITKLYRQLLEWATEEETVKECMTKWAVNFGRTIRMEQWETMWNRKMKQMYSYDLKENLIKMFYRWYITPQKLGYYYKNMNTACWKCKQHEGTFFHMWWTCDKAKKYWKIIHESMQKFLKTNHQFKPEFFLLGITELKSTENEELLINYMTTAARIIYAKYWRQEETPDADQWLLKLMEIKNMDRLTYIITKHQGVPRKSTDWEPVLAYLQQRRMTTFVQ